LSPTGRRSRTRPADRQSNGESAAKVSLPFHAVAGEHFAHGLDQLLRRHRELRRPALAPFLVRGDRFGGFLTLAQILYLDLVLGLLVGALNDHARRTAPVGILELRPELA